VYHRYEIYWFTVEKNKLFDFVVNDSIVSKYFVYLRCAKY